MGSVIEFNKFFCPEEVLIGDELWNRLSGEKNTMQQILDIINKIATTDFVENLMFLENPKNKKSNPGRYQEILKQWNLSDNSRI